MRRCYQSQAGSPRAGACTDAEGRVENSALRRDPRTAATSITVECDGGVATLAGMVGSEKEAAAAARVAAAVSGIARVDNQLKSAATAGSRYRREG